FQAEDGIRDATVTGVQTCALPVAGRFSDSEPPGCSQGAQRAVFCAVRVADFLAEGAGWGASPGRGGELGCQAQQVLKKFVRLASAFPSPPTRSLSNRKGRGRRS